MSKSKNIDGTLALPNFDKTRSMIRTSVYLAAAYYRLANLTSAEKYLKPLIKIKTDQGNIHININCNEINDLFINRFGRYWSK